MSRLAQDWVGFTTIVRREVNRVLRIWIQTVVPPAITMALYYIIFGNLIGQRIGSMGGHSYMEFIAPGLIMMSIITNSYSNVVSSFFGAKFGRHVEELMVSPLPDAWILAGYVMGGVMRGLIVGVERIVIPRKRGERTHVGVGDNAWLRQNLEPRLQLTTFASHRTSCRRFPRTWCSRFPY